MATLHHKINIIHITKFSISTLQRPFFKHHALFTTASYIIFHKTKRKKRPAKCARSNRASDERVRVNYRKTGKGLAPFAHVHKLQHYYEPSCLRTRRVCVCVYRVKIQYYDTIRLCCETITTRFLMKSDVIHYADRAVLLFRFNFRALLRHVWG